jgi:hypothetical protein
VAYPTTYDDFTLTTDLATPADHVLFDRVISNTDRVQHRLGLSGDAASSSPSATVTSNVKFLLAAGGGITRQAAAPSSPATDDLWIDNDDPDRPLVMRVGAAWELVGADAITLRGRAVDAAITPTDGMVLTWDAAGVQWRPEVPTGGMVDPMSTPGDMVWRDAANALARFPKGLDESILAIDPITHLQAWIPGSTYIAAPASMPVGSVLVRSAVSTWVALEPSAASGDVLTGQGTGAVPIWAPVPAQVPGSDIPAPSGPRVGALLQWNGTIWDKVLPGAAGYVLTSHGDNNVVGSLLTWNPITALVNPMTAVGSMIAGTTAGAPVEVARPASSGDWPDSVLGISGGVVAWRKLDGVRVAYLDWVEGTAPATPASGYGRFYVLASDSHPYFKGNDGVAHDLLAAGTGYSVVQDEGSGLTVRTTLNFVGAGVSAADTGGVTVVTVPGAGADYAVANWLGGN